jgi:hypothetical protein
MLRLNHPVLGILAVLLCVLASANFVWLVWELMSPGAGERAQVLAQRMPIIQVLGGLASVYLVFVWVIPFTVGRTGPDTARRVEQLRGSGPALASAWCSARIGYASWRGPLVHVLVHPGGIVVKPLLMEARAIRKDEVVALEISPPRAAGLIAGRVQVRHISPDIRSRLLLYIDHESAAGRALRALRPGAPLV